jgi:AraC-like DNA-binding protein
MRKASPKLVRSASLTNFAKVAQRAGLDPHRLLREFGLPARCLREPELKVPGPAVRALLEAAAERSGMEAFGLLMGESRRILGSAGLLIREQPTVRLMLETAARYATRLHEMLHLSVEEIDEVVVVRQDLIVGSSGSVRQSTELAICVVFRTLRAVLGPDWHPRRVYFAHDPPRDRSVHKRIFGPAVEFGHDFTGIVCSRKDLEVANPDADVGLARQAEHLVEAQFATATIDNISVQVQGSVANLLASGRCTIDLVAQTLGLSRRTLHRRLAAERQSFSAIVDAVRRELAGRYVADPRRPLAEVSMLLGFSGPSAFARWYRRQFGDTASAARRPRRGAAA